MMLDGVLVEGVDRNRRLGRLQLELSARHEPEQITFAAAMGAVAFHRRIERAFDFEFDLAAVATTLVRHVALR